MEANDFVANYLYQNNIEIFKGEEKLYDKFTQEDFDYSLPSSIIKGAELIDKPIKLAITHAELLEHGWHVVIKKDSKRHAIAKISTGKTVKDIGNVKIILDAREQEVWLEGGNTESNKIKLGLGGRKSKGLRKHYMMTEVDGKPKIIKPEFDEMKAKRELIRDKWMGGYKGIVESVKIDDKDIPFMISVNGEIVCLSKEADMQNIYVCGDRGGGKSILLMTLVTKIKYKWNDWILLIDPLGIFHTCYDGMKTQKFIDVFKKIGEKPIGLPINYFYMAGKDMHRFDENLSFIYPLDTWEFLNKYRYFTYGVERWKLGGAERYLNRVVKELGYKKTKEEVSELLEKAFPGGKKDTLRGMKDKWIETFDSIYKFKFLSVFYNENLKWKTVNDGEVYEGDPIISSLFANLVTVLNTNYAKKIPADNSACSRNMLANLFQKILDYKNTGDKAKLQRIWICPDELGDIYKKGTGKGSDNLSDILVEFSTQGRIVNIGSISTIQGFNNIHPDMVQNSSTFLFTPINPSGSRGREIRQQFGLSQEEFNQLKDLKKTQREVIAIQKFPFAVYDKNGNKKEGKRFYRGWAIPPNCNTLKAG